MTPSPSTAATRRRVLFLAAASVLALAAAGAFWEVEAVGMGGLSLVMLLALAALALAARELDQDVIYLAGLGALMGAAHARLSGGAALAVAGAGETWTVLANALAGGVVGAAAGDVAQSETWRIPRGALGRALAGAWWSHRRGPARWLAALGCLAVAAAALATGLLIFLANAAPVAANYSSELVPNYKRYLEEVETYPGMGRVLGESLLRVWYAYGLLLPALAICLRLPSLRQSELEADRLLSRVALAHCLSLAFLGGHLLLAALSGLSLLSVGSTDPGTPYGDLAAVTAAIRDVQPPLIMLLVTVVLLGRWRLRYLRRFGWMPALGAGVLAACALAAFGAVFLANARMGPH